MSQTIEIIPIIDNLERRELHCPRVRTGRIGRKNRPIWRSPLRKEYTVEELTQILKSPSCIWGFNPKTGRTEVLNRAVIQDAVDRNPTRMGTVYFTFDEESHDSLHLIPSHYIYAPMKGPTFDWRYVSPTIAH